MQSKRLLPLPHLFKEPSSSKSTFSCSDLGHPSLHAKKYDEAKDRWQARINDDWRFYFKIDQDTYRITEIIPHPK